MPSTKKRARSPEVDGLPSKRQSWSNRIYQNPPLKKRWRGPKYDRLKALEKIERKRRCPVFQAPAYIPNTTRAPQPSTGPAPVKSPLQRCPKPTVPSSPPSLPAGGDEDGSEGFSDSPVSSHVPLGSNLRTASGYRDNRALLRQLRHLDDHTDHTSAWNKRRNNQAIQWKSVAIPRLMPTYLANRVATESGRLPPPPKPKHQCKCNKVASKVEMMTWDRSSHQILSICECYPADVQLVEMGYFPCAPVRPTLAFDINLLEFVTTASHHMAPNVTGWASTLQNFLSIRGYHVGKKDTIRRRFGNALHWYQVLVAMADQEVDTYVQNTTPAVTTSPDNTNATDRSSSIESNAPTSGPLGRTAAIVCVDANFAQ